MKIAVAGGDNRMLAAANRFEKLGYEIIKVALGSGSVPPEEIPADIAAVILPSPCQKDGKLNSPMSETSHDIGDILKAGNEKTLFFGGSLPSAGENFIDYAKIEVFTLKNALSTAEGAISLALSLREKTLFGSKALVIGYGRIGSHLLRLLSAFGAKVTVAARREEVRFNAEADGAEAIATHEIESSLKSYDVIFNTVPYPLVSESALNKAKSDALIIELASLPGGFACESEKIIKAHALPGRLFPISAGDYIFDAVYPILIERGITP